MTRILSTIAGDRLRASPHPPQRYGLSVVLRKGYPAMGNWKLGTGNWKPTVRGADVRQVAWEDMPADVVALVRRRVEKDPVVATAVLAQPRVDVVRVEGKREVTLQAGAPVTVVDVAPNAHVILNEVGEHLRALPAKNARADAEVRPYGARLVLLRVGAGARVRWFASVVGAPGFTFVERLALLAQDAVLEHHSALVSANAIRENVHVMLDGPGATVRVQTLFAGSADNQFDLGVTAEHRAPRTVSDLRAKGVLSGKAQGVYRGLVRVEKNATGSDGYQRCDALLLSPTAEVDPIPNLEIETNDVRCTHGVTVSRPDAEQLFYLRSRGLDESAARDLLVEGFAGTMLSAYPESQREELQAAMQNVLCMP